MTILFYLSDGRRIRYTSQDRQEILRIEDLARHSGDYVFSSSDSFGVGNITIFRRHVVCYELIEDEEEGE